MPAELNIIRHYKLLGAVIPTLHKKDGPAVIYPGGNQEWWLDGKLHRKDGPAKEFINGDQEWYIKGKRHRENGPAIIRGSHKEYWVNGGLHRLDGPAFESANGKKMWAFNGQPHREDGPAIERADGSKEWWVNGKKHRTDGPAVITKNKKIYYLDDEEIPYVQYNILTSTTSYKYTSIDGSTKYYCKNYLHRTDGPAVIKGEEKKYYLFGKHLTEKVFNKEVKNIPKISSPYGEGEIVFQFKLNGTFHRLDGPAILRLNRSSEKVLYSAYYINGKFFKKKDFINEKEVKDYKAKTSH